MPEGQAEDEARAIAKAAVDWNRKIGIGRLAMVDWNRKKEAKRWEEGKYIEWNTRQGGWKGTEADRSERRSRNIRGN